MDMIKKRYTVITHRAKGNGHLNEQDLLPASCRLVTGIAVLATSKQSTGLTLSIDRLSFPQRLINNILSQKEVAGLFYSYLRTRESETESRAFFEAEMLPEIVKALSGGIQYGCLDSAEQQRLSGKMRLLLNNGLATFLYTEKDLFGAGKNSNDLAFAEYIANSTVQYLYTWKKEIFNRTVQVYEQPQPYECGNISLLINGNNFLLRDFALTANRKPRSLKNELFPLHEPLEVNSNVHTVFKNAKNNGNNSLTIKTIVEYEPDK